MVVFDPMEKRIMFTINIREAMSRLLDFLKCCRAEKPRRRVPGSARGKIFMADNFDDPLPDEILDAFYK